MNQRFKYIKDFENKNDLQLRSSSKRRKQTLLFATSKAEYFLMNKEDVIFDLSPKIPPYTIIDWAKSTDRNTVNYSQFCKNRGYL